jgi:hypothetical protein
LVVALAGALRTVGGYAVHRREWSRGGWSAYAEHAPLVLGAADPGWHPLPAALLWIALIAIWAGTSVWLLGLPGKDRQ